MENKIMYIYKITNKNNGKIYIGQTSKTDVNYMGSGKIIIKAIKKYGKEFFMKEIIDTGYEKEIINEKEKYWIAFYKSTDRNIGYNVSIGGNGGNLGDKVNEKISNSNKGKILVKDKLNNIFKVLKNDERFLSGELVGFNKGNIPHNKGKSMSEEQKLKLNKPKSEETKIKLKKAALNKICKKILCLNNNKIYTMKEASLELNLNIPNIIDVLKGRAKKTKGYSFIYL